LNHLRRYQLLAIAMACATSISGPRLIAMAADETLDVTVSGAWSRATPPGAEVGVAYMNVTVHGGPDRLLGAESALAERAEIHEMRTDQGAMQMRTVGPIELTPAQELVLEPGGLHVMLIGLRESLVAGEHHTVTLVFEHAGRVPVDVEVRAP